MFAKGGASLEAGHEAGSERRREVGGVLLVGAQLGLAVAVVQLFGLQDESFRRVFGLLVAGFLVHAFLPLRLRAAFFCLLSVGALALALGVGNAAWILALGGGLVAIVHLPIVFAYRVALLAAVGGGLAYLRSETSLYPSIERLVASTVGAERLEAPWSGAIWPILASMFMFRLAIYLYDREHERTRAPLSHVFAYFFMAPNVCFPLFPVVDYKKFRRSYYAGGAVPTYQRGATWVVRGLVQLLLYRAVYHFVAIDPSLVVDAASFARFAVGSFLLYLQVSGQFHLIVGMLLLFGWDLPETHHRYLLASSFTDFWRRINIYWKDFMMKLVYYPVHFRLRRLGERWALVLATLVVFAATWFLHLYQWFWLRGSGLFEGHDVLFWSILAVAVVVNSLYEMKFGRPRPIDRRSTPRESIATGLATAATFASICLLWSMWSSESLGQWLSMWEAVGPGALPLAGATIVLLYAASLGIRHAGSSSPRPRGATAASRPLARAGFPWAPVAANLVVLTGIVTLTAPGVAGRLGEEAARVVRTVRAGEQLNDRDLARLELGYYESLIGVSRHNQELWNTYMGRPEGWNDWPEGALVPTDDLREFVLAPDLNVTFKRATVRTNADGLRDDAYGRHRRDGVPRVAFVGGSHVFGSGVEHAETFEARFERRWAAERGGPVEILNFAYTGRNPLHFVPIVDETVVAFEPDVVVVFAHHNDDRRLVKALAKAVWRGVPLHYEFLEAGVAGAGLRPGMSREAMERRLLRRGPELLRGAYREIARSCRKAGAAPVAVFLPMPYERLGPDDVARDLAPAREAGFETVDLVEVYRGFAVERLTLAPWDTHPNPFAHGLVADALAERLRPVLERTSAEARGRMVRAR